MNLWATCIELNSLIQMKRLSNQLHEADDLEDANSILILDFRMEPNLICLLTGWRHPDQDEKNLKKHWKSFENYLLFYRKLS